MAVRSAVRIVRALPAVEELAIDECDAAPRHDVVALCLIVVRDGALQGVPRRVGVLCSTRDRWRRVASSSRTCRRRGIAATSRRRSTASSGSGLRNRHDLLLPAVNDAQLHAPAVADIDNPGVLVTGVLALFGGADLVDLCLCNDGGSRGIPWPDLSVGRQRNQNRRREQNFRCHALHSVSPEQIFATRRVSSLPTSAKATVGFTRQSADDMGSGEMGAYYISAV